MRLRRAPVAVTFWTVMTAATAALAELPARERASLVLSSSTNLDELSRAPLRVLAASILWVSPTDYVMLVVPTVLLLVAIELRAGSRSALLVLAAGHVGATLLTAAGIATGIHAGTVSPEVANAVDVGVSYATFALVGYGATLADASWRPWLLAAALGMLAAALALDADFTSFGHLFSLALGVARGAHRRAATALAAALLLVAPLAGLVMASPAAQASHASLSRAHSSSSPR